MAFRPVDSTALLWQRHGLRFLLRESLDPSLSLLTYGVRYPAQQARPSSAPVRPSAGPSVRPPVRPPVRPEPAPAKTPLRPLPEPPRPKYPPIEAWPEPWQTLARQVKPGRIIWTYPLLGCDLLHVETTDIAIRRDFLRRILTDTPPFPPGTHTFWPYAVPKDASSQSLETDLKLFWAGVYHFGARAIVFLGPEAGGAVLRAPRPYTHCQLPHGKEAMVFQEISTLREQNDVFQRMMRMVRALLARFSIQPLVR